MPVFTSDGDENARVTLEDRVRSPSGPMELGATGKLLVELPLSNAALQQPVAVYAGRRTATEGDYQSFVWSLTQGGLIEIVKALTRKEQGQTPSRRGQTPTVRRRNFGAKRTATPGPRLASRVRPILKGASGLDAGRRNLRGGLLPSEMRAAHLGCRAVAPGRGANQRPQRVLDVPGAKRFSAPESNRAVFSCTAASAPDRGLAGRRTERAVTPGWNSWGSRFRRICTPGRNGSRAACESQPD